MENLNQLEDQMSVLLDEICDAYKNYCEKSKTQSPPSNAFGGLFGGWFSTNNPEAASPINHEFLQLIDSLTSQLSDLLSKFRQENVELCELVALKAMKTILGPKPKTGKPTLQLYMIATEYYSAKFVPFLGKNGLTEIRGFMLEITPKIRMLPKQSELLKEIESCLKAQSNKAE